MADALNQRIADRLTRRQLQALRLEAREQRDVWAMLALLETDLLGTLKASDPTDFTLHSRRLRAVETVLKNALEPLIDERYKRIAAAVTAFVVDLAQREARATQDAVNGVSDGEPIEAMPSERQVRQAVTATLFPSPTRPTDMATIGADWWQRQADSLAQRLGDQLRVSVSLEESLVQMVARVRGTSDQAFKDGLMERARQDAQRLLRTQVTNALSEARAAVAEANADNVILVHVSVLDGRTCLEGTTLVKTPFGLRAICDIQEGDSVYGGSGCERSVLATHAQEVSELVRITFSDGTSIVCTPDHAFLTEESGWVIAEKLQENTVLRTVTML